MMKAVLVAAGASVVFGQGMSCGAQNNFTTAGDYFALDNCTTANMGCVLSTGYCARTATTCSTASKTCDAASDCLVGTSPTNIQTCSMCTDSCRGKTTDATCSASANCKWQKPLCTDAPVSIGTQCGGATSSAACVARDHCLWLDAIITPCGVRSAGGSCQPCNSTFGLSTELKSALFKSIGNKCTWKASGSYTSDFTAQVTALNQNAKCPALTTTGMMDSGALSTVFQSYFAAGTVPVCDPVDCTMTTAYCARTATACSTASKTCDAASDCKAGTSPTNIQTCSMCTDSCRDKTTDATCSASANCKWQLPVCAPPVVPTPGTQCGSGMASSAACIALDNCLWLDAIITPCGARQAGGSCQPCNSTFGLSTDLKSAMLKSIGNKCTWKASGSYASDFTAQVTALNQNGKCPALTTTGTMDKASLSTVFQSYFAAGTVPVCAPAANSAGVLVPALAAMALLVLTV